MWKREESSAAAGSHHSPPPPAANSRDAADKLVMNLGKSVMIKGELSGSEDLILYGRMEGSVKLPEYTLTIGPDADIRAEDLRKDRRHHGRRYRQRRRGRQGRDQIDRLGDGRHRHPRLAIQDGGCMRGKVATSKSELKQNRA